MPKVLNKRTARSEELANAVNVGRPSKWGNPFSHLEGTLAAHKVGSRDEAVDRFNEWVMHPDQAALRQAARKELRGKDLWCWCAPLRCHATTWLQIANE